MTDSDEWPDHWGEDPKFWSKMSLYPIMGTIELKALVELAANTIAELEHQRRGLRQANEHLVSIVARLGEREVWSQFGRDND